MGGNVANVDLECGQSLSLYANKSDGSELTFTPEAMIAATSFCQTSTESQESLPDPAMVRCVEMCVECGLGVMV